MRRQCRTSGQLTAKSISIKGAKRRSGDCARKAAEQKSAEGVVGHDVGKASEELISFLLWMNRLCSRLLANRDEFISELFSLPFEFGFQGFLAVDVACCPDGLVVFDLTLHDCVKHNRNLVGSGGCGSRWPDFALHAAEIISHRC